MNDGIIKELETNDIVLVLISGEEYTHKTVQVMRELAQLGKKVCYVTLNKPYETLLKEIDDGSNANDNLHFIDCVGQRDAKNEKNCTYISSPNELSKIDLAISNVLKEQKTQLLFFDSLATLLAYEDGATIVKFAHSIITELRMRNVKGIFVNPEGKNAPMAIDLDMFVDKEIKL